MQSKNITFKKKEPLCIGITGGIGSGKTTVCKILEDLGAKIFYADKEAKKIMVENITLRNQIIVLLGEQAYIKKEDTSWELNSKYIAHKIFHTSNKELLNQINYLVHPMVQDVFTIQKKKSHEKGVPVLVLESALLFESGSNQLVDTIWVVTAPTKTRIKRVLNRDQITQDALSNRMKQQISQEKLISKASVVITNNDTLISLKKQVQNKWYQLSYNKNSFL